MKQNIIVTIEKMISYEFHNKRLLEQAFTRRSFSKEDPSRLDNEVLEFIGDGVLSQIVLKRLVYAFTDNEKNGLVSSKTEKEFTEMKQKLVQKSMLAQKMDELSLIQFLEVGAGDKEQQVIKQDSVKEDLFEAIIGAVAIDCDFDQDILDELVDVMMDPNQYIDNDFEDTLENHIGILQEWYQSNGYGLPEYVCVDQWENTSSLTLLQFGNNYRDFIYHWRFSLEIEGKTFSAEANSKKEAKTNIAEQVIEYLKDNNMFYSLADIVGEPTLDRAINQLQELFQKNWIEEPVYFEEEVFRLGIIQWKVECRVARYKCYFFNIANSKKEAKKNAALSMLKYIDEEGFK